MSRLPLYMSCMTNPACGNRHSGQARALALRTAGRALLALTLGSLMLFNLN